MWTSVREGCRTIGRSRAGRPDTVADTVEIRGMIMSDSPGAGTTAEPSETPPPPRDMTLLMTYRFLRIGLVLAVVALAVSVVWEIGRTGCVRGSISAYFYSPVRTIFVGSLLAIGLALIVLQGEGDTEEFSLNLAGMFAPMVAIIPIGVNTECDPEFAALPFDTDTRAALISEIEAQTRAGTFNNAAAYFGTLGLLYVIMFIWPRQFSKSPDDPKRVAKVRWAVALYLLVVVTFAIGAGARWNGDSSWAHYVAAVLMFVAFGVVVARNAWWRHRYPVSRWYIRFSKGIAIGMIAGVVLGGVLWWLDVDRMVFILEAVEILLFGAFWFAQTVEFWDRDRRDPAPAPASSPSTPSTPSTPPQPRSGR